MPQSTNTDVDRFLVVGWPERNGMGGWRWWTSLKTRILHSIIVVNRMEAVTSWIVSICDKRAASSIRFLQPIRKSIASSFPWTKVTPTKNNVFSFKDCRACKETHTHTFLWRQEFGDWSRMGNTPMVMDDGKTYKVRMYEYVYACVRPLRVYCYWFFRSLSSRSWCEFRETNQWTEDAFHISHPM